MLPRFSQIVNTATDNRSGRRLIAHTTLPHVPGTFAVRIRSFWLQTQA